MVSAHYPFGWLCYLEPAPAEIGNASSHMLTENTISCVTGSSNQIDWRFPALSVVISKPARLPFSSFDWHQEPKPFSARPLSNRGCILAMTQQFGYFAVSTRPAQHTRSLESQGS